MAFGRQSKQIETYSLTELKDLMTQQEKMIATGRIDTKTIMEYGLTWGIYRYLGGKAGTDRMYANAFCRLPNTDEVQSANDNVYMFTSVGTLKCIELELEKSGKAGSIKEYFKILKKVLPNVYNAQYSRFMHAWKSSGCLECDAYQLLLDTIYKQIVCVNYREYISPEQYNYAYNFVRSHLYK